MKPGLVWLSAWLTLSCAQARSQVPVPAPQPTEEERAAEVVGALVESLILATHGTVEESPLTQYVDSVGRRVVAAARLPITRWSFTVLDQSEAQAYALPGGRVYVTLGALASLNDEAQLACVLAHEIGHVAAGHSLAALWARVRGVSLGDQRDEQEDEQADQLGIGYVIKAGYDPTAFPVMMNVMRDQKDSTGSWPPGRIPKIWRRIADARGGELGRDRYLQHIDGMVLAEESGGGRLEGNRYVDEKRGLSVVFPPAFQVKVDGSLAKGGLGDPEKGLVLMPLGPSTTSTLLKSAVSEAMVGKRRVTQLLVGKAVSGKTKTEHGDSWGAILDTPRHSFWIACKGPDVPWCERVVDSMLTTATAVSRTATAPRLRIVRTETNASFAEAGERWCGKGVDATRLARLNGLRPTQRVREGELIKCVP